MPRVCGSRPRATLFAVLAAALGASALSAPAGAEDGTSPVVSAPDIPSVPALESEIAEAVEEALASATAAEETSDATGAPVEEVGELAPVPDAPTVPDTAQGSGDIPEASDPASTVASTGDTTVDSGDTADDSDRSPASTSAEDDAVAAPVAEAAASQPRPTPTDQLNVNLSVRVSSPGSNGAVTQANEATMPPAEPVTAETTRGEQAAPETGTRPAAPPKTASGNEWYWEWNCVSTPGIGTISPPVSTNGSMPTSWTWIWNCGDNFEQYQGDAPSQYQQINANISIRIDSPGDDGAVTQTNVAAAAPGRVAIAIPHVSIPLPSIAVESTFSIELPAITQNVPPLPRLLAEVGGSIRLPSLGDVLVNGADWQTATEQAVQELEATLEVVIGIEPAPPAAFEPSNRGLQQPTLARHAVIPPLATAPTVVVRAPKPVAPTTWTPQTQVSGKLVHSTLKPPEAERTRPAPRWKQATRAPRSGSSPSSGATATVAGPGSAAGIGLPTFLALLILAVVLDLARRVALERVTLPSGHWRRPPDTPG